MKLRWFIVYITVARINFEINPKFNQLIQNYTQTDLNSNCPVHLPKTTSTLPGYPLVPGGQEITPEPRLWGALQSSTQKLLFLVKFGCF